MGRKEYGFIDDRYTSGFDFLLTIPNIKVL